jgi:hypothetical protein
MRSGSAFGGTLTSGATLMPIGLADLQSEPRPKLGLLPSGPDPVGEWYVPRQPPSLYWTMRGNFAIVATFDRQSV